MYIHSRCRRRVTGLVSKRPRQVPSQPAQAAGPRRGRRLGVSGRRRHVSDARWRLVHAGRLVQQQQQQADGGRGVERRPLARRLRPQLLALRVRATGQHVRVGVAPVGQRARGTLFQSPQRSMMYDVTSG